MFLFYAPSTIHLLIFKTCFCHIRLKYEYKGSIWACGIILIKTFCAWNARTWSPKFIQEMEKFGFIVCSFKSLKGTQMNQKRLMLAKLEKEIYYFKVKLQVTLKSFIQDSQFENLKKGCRDLDVKKIEFVTKFCS